MTPDQERAARVYKKRQDLDKRLADLVAKLERNPRIYVKMCALLVALLLIMLITVWRQ